MQIKRLLTVAALALGVGSAWAQTDVTSQYIQNADFSTESDWVTDNVAAGGSANSNAVTDWTSNGGSSWSSSAVVAYGSTGQVNGVNAPAADPAGAAEGAALGISTGWGGTVQYTQTVTLPAGAWKFSYTANNQLSGKTQNKSQCGYKIGDGSWNYTSRTSWPYNSWVTDEIAFDLNEEATVTFAIGLQAISGGSGDNAKVFFDNVKLVYGVDATLLTNEIATAQAQLATYEAGTEWYNSLAQAIADAQAVTPSNNTVLNAAVSALQQAEADAAAAYEQAQKEAAEAARKEKWATVDGGVYYLKNVSTDTYLGAGNSWGTQASLRTYGTPITIAALENGTYTLESRVSNGGSKYYVNGGYMDGEANSIEILSEGDAFLLYSQNSEAYYTAPAEGTAVELWKEYADGSKWQLIAEADMIAALAAATEENPMDATFLVKDADLGRNNRDASAWSKTNVAGPKTSHGDNGGNADNTNYLCEAYQTTFDMNQTLSNIPNGLYEVKATAFYRGEGEDLPIIYAVSGANEGSVTFPQITGSENNMLQAAVSFAAGNYLSDGVQVLVTNNTLKIGVKLENNTSLWSIWDNFQLSYLRPATEAEVQDAAIENIASKAYDLIAATTVPTANIGEAPFQYNQDYIDDYLDVVGQMEQFSSKDEFIAYVKTQGQTLAEVEEFYAALEELVEDMNTLNAPAEDKRYTATLTYEGWGWDGKAVTYIANDRADMGLYNIQYAAAPNANYAQAFIFTPVEGVVNGYKLSQIDAEGEERFVSTGVPYGGNASQIRTTLNADEALVVEVRATGTEGKWNLFNTEANNFIGSQDAGFFTVNSHIDFILAEAAEVAGIEISEAGYATFVAPVEVSVPAGVKAYTVTDVENDVLTITPTEAIPANTPVLLEGVEGAFSGETLGYSAQKPGVELTAGLLTGVYEDTPAAAGSYVLQNHEGAVAFYLVGEEVIPTIGANKAYLTYSAPAEAKALYLPGQGEATAIDAIAAMTAGQVDGIYTAGGVKVNGLQKGLNIVKANGKTVKVLVK